MQASTFFTSRAQRPADWKPVGWKLRTTAGVAAAVLGGTMLSLQLLLAEHYAGETAAAAPATQVA